MRKGSIQHSQMITKNDESWDRLNHQDKDNNDKEIGLN